MYIVTSTGYLLEIASSLIDVDKLVDCAIFTDKEEMLNFANDKFKIDIEEVRESIIWIGLSNGVLKESTSNGLLWSLELTNSLEEYVSDFEL